MAHPVTPAFTKIFQASIDQGQTPEDWKTATVMSHQYSRMVTRVNQQTTDLCP
jgi:hypothetical protein